MVAPLCLVWVILGHIGSYCHHYDEYCLPPMIISYLKVCNNHKGPHGRRALPRVGQQHRVGGQGVQTPQA